jgi:osmotically inducible protein OsmC
MYVRYLLTKFAGVLVARSSEAERRSAMTDGSAAVSLSFRGECSFVSPFEDPSGTHPEEVPRAAAGCFVDGAGLRALPTAQIETSGTAQISPSADGFSPSRNELVTVGDVPRIDLAAFSAHTETAKRSCPASRALAGVEITLDPRRERLKSLRSISAQQPQAIVPIRAPPFGGSHHVGQS